MLGPFDGHSIPGHLYAAHQVSTQFLRDFEKSGIHLGEQERAAFVSLSDQVIHYGRHFLSPSESTNRLDIGSSEVTRLPLRYHQDKVDGQAIDADSAAAHYLLRNSKDSALRRKIWTAQNKVPAENIEALEGMLRTRGQLARLVGKQSWAEAVLEDKMARTPGTRDPLYGIVCAYSLCR